MKGMEMMLASFGLDPAKLKEEMGKVIQGIKNEFDKLHQSDQKILSNQQEMKDKLEAIQCQIQTALKMSSQVALLPAQPQPQPQPQSQPPQPQ